MRARERLQPTAIPTTIAAPAIAQRARFIACSEASSQTPSALGARVRRSGDNINVTDGPFTESKELVGGFAILKADSKEEAVELARKFLKVAGEGECELRQLYDANCADANGAGSIEREVALKA